MQSPHNLEAEESLVGSMLLSISAVTTAIEQKITKDDFYFPRLGTLFEEVVQLYKDVGSVDYLVLVDALDRKDILEKVGGKQYVLEVQAKPISSLNAEYYGRIVLEHSQLRQLERVAFNINNLVYSDKKLDEVINESEQLLYAVSEKKYSQHATDASSLAEKAYDHMIALRKRETSVGIPVGFRQFDNMVLGLQPSMLYILAARPAMGKSAVALNMALNMAKSGVPSAFFSLEMADIELMNRLISTEARVPYRMIQSGNLDDATLGQTEQAVKRISDMPIYIDDSAQCSMLELRAKARRLKSKHGIQAIFIDYLQLMDIGRAESRQVGVADVSRNLKLLSKELEIPVVCLAQLNRQVEYRQDKKPMLADLRESGSLEQDADVVMFLYRDEVYDPDSADKGVAELIVAKNRRGATGSVRLAFISEQVRFENIAL